MQNVVGSVLTYVCNAGEIIVVEIQFWGRDAFTQTKFYFRHFETPKINFLFNRVFHGNLISRKIKKKIKISQTIRNFLLCEKKMGVRCNLSMSINILFKFRIDHEGKQRLHTYL